LSATVDQPPGSSMYLDRVLFIEPQVMLSTAESFGVVSSKFPVRRARIDGRAYYLRYSLKWALCWGMQARTQAAGPVHTISNPATLLRNDLLAPASDILRLF
jgi:hypothetical protein